jgi:hypothetical protein
MPSRSALKAASTPSSRALALMLLLFSSEQFSPEELQRCLSAVRIVVRGRGAVVDEFEFCATTTPHVRTIKANSLSINKLLYHGIPLRNRCTDASRPSTSKISNIDGPTACQ